MPATPNLPSRDFENTSRFYSTLGFAETWRDKGWMILKRGRLTLEFFPHPELDRWQAGLAVAFGWTTWMLSITICKDAGIPEGCKGQPRLHPPEAQSGGRRVGAFVDPDGSLVRLIQN